MQINLDKTPQKRLIDVEKGLHIRKDTYGVVSSSRLLKIIGLFCKRALQKRPIFSKDTYNFQEPTTRSHPIRIHSVSRLLKFMGLFYKRAL